MPTYTYDAARGSDRDKARELLGDAPVDAPGSTTLDADLALRSDEDMDAILAREGFARGVAWLAAGLYAEFAQQPSRISASGKTIDYADRLKAWEALAAPVRALVGGQGERPPPPRQAKVDVIAAGTSTRSKLR